LGIGGLGVGGGGVVGGAAKPPNKKNQDPTQKQKENIFL